MKRVVKHEGNPDTEPVPPWVTVRCCRVWEVSAWHPIGKCGLCGEVPTPWD